MKAMINMEDFIEKLEEIIASYAIRDGVMCGYYFPCIPAEGIAEEILEYLKIKGA